MKTLITGAVGSGTTFMASLYREMGYDLGENIEAQNHRNQERQVRGLEHIPLLELMLSWEAYFLPVLRVGMPRIARNLDALLAMDDPEVAKLVGPDVARVSAGLPSVVKCPPIMHWLGLWLQAGGVRPEQVIVMMRDTLDASLSNLRDGFTQQPEPLADRADTLMGYGSLLETLVMYDIPWTIVEFPRCIYDVNYVHIKLEFPSIPKFVRAYMKVARPDEIATTEEFQRGFREIKKLNLPEHIPSATMTSGITAEVSDDKQEITFSFRENTP